MSDLVRVTGWAEALLRLHLPDAGWSFGFDRAVTRAGQCDHAARRITVSRHLAARYEDDEVHQILLHEVAHALAGPRAGHGPTWRRVARELGYTGSRLHHGAAATDRARWHGTCPAGHEHVRFRRPNRPLACGVCSRRFSRANVIEWRERALPPPTG